ncbi:hypothetical protein AUJ66_03250 [Candidatus Desantisbacteria bacterium CG1_02_38_46]|nr:MAG: hypothetical protein AUJ66_03250 [Candidatus Desantisbacteria bacterium CG1_02_38_46]
MKSGFVKTAGFNPPSGGRPAQKLQLNPDDLYIGLDLGATHIAGVITNSKGSINNSKNIEISADEEKDSIIQKILEILDFLLTDIQHKRVIGIGFASPGIIDRQNGISVYAANLSNWQNVPIRQILQGKFGIPVLMEDCSRTMGLAEKVFGCCKDVDNFILMDLGFGIGCAIFNNGVLHTGATFDAGEIGHTIVNSSGKICRCGKRGCLEAIVSGFAISKEYEQRASPARVFDVKEISGLAAGGDVVAQDIIKESGKYIGIATANLINLLNPEIIVFAGGLTKIGDLLLQSIYSAINEYAYQDSLKAVEFKNSVLGDYGGALGADALVMDKVFEFSCLEGKR